MSKKIIVCIHDQDKSKPIITLTDPSTEELRELNSRGYGIFETANSFIGNKRRKENLSRLDEVYADMDVCKDGDGMPEKEREEKKHKLKNAIDWYCPASVYVVTKNGLQPRWWISETSIDKETQQKYVNVISGIIEYSKELGSAGDPVKDVARILRKPGFYHLKSDPYLVTEISGSGKMHTLDELKNYFWKEEVNPAVGKLVPDGDLDAIDIRTIVIDVWKEKGHVASFDKNDHLVIDGVVTATFKDHLGKNFIATTSSDFPAKGNAVTYVAETLGISTKQAFRWLRERYYKEGDAKNNVARKSEIFRKAKIVRMSDVQPVPIQWLWPGRIARGKLTLIAGDPGLGKSLLTAHIASVVSKGKSWPLNEGGPDKGSVIFLSAEDDPADTIRPRLDAADADSSRIHVLQAITEVGEGEDLQQRMFSFKKDLSVLEELLDELKDCQLLVVDPVSAYLDGADSHNNTDVRGLLAPLADLATRHNVAVILVQHLNKNSGGGAMYRSMGSIAFVAAARSALIVARNPDNPEERFVMPVKNNLAKDTTGLVYTVIQSENGAPCVRWGDSPITLTADEVLSVSSSGEQQETDFAVEFLRDQLISGPLPVRDINREAKKVGLTEKMLRTAAKKLGVTTKKSTFLGGWVWGLPDQDDRNSQDDAF